MRTAHFPALSLRTLAAITAIIALVVTVCWLFSGCASPGPYRTLPQASDQGQGENHAIVENHDDKGYRVGFVEFDEQGWFWMPDRSQLSDVQMMISEAAQLGRGGKARGIILVAFVHGWKNNAEGLDPPESNNVSDFRNELQNIAESEREDARKGPAQREPRPVVGVYLGWPGLSVKPDPLKEVTFYSRKNTGDRVGQYGGVTEVLSRLNKVNESINGEIQAQKDSGAQESYFIVVGHSFGAQVVYDSLLTIMTDNLVGTRVSRYMERLRTGTPREVHQETSESRQYREPELVRPFGNLVVLVNPAFEGERYFNLKSLSELFQYRPAQRPVLAIFCSETDWATHYAFRAGRFFGTLFRRYRQDDLHDLQRESDVQTIPWTDEFVTHRLVAKGEYLPGNAVPETTRWDEGTRARAWNIGECVLYPVKGDGATWTPFYVARVSKAVIDGHNDIWNGVFQGFLTHFIGTVAQEKKAQGKKD